MSNDLISQDCIKEEFVVYYYIDRFNRRTYTLGNFNPFKGYQLNRFSYIYKYTKPKYTYLINIQAEKIFQVYIKSFIVRNFNSSHYIPPPPDLYLSFKSLVEWHKLPKRFHPTYTEIEDWKKPIKREDKEILKDTKLIMLKVPEQIISYLIQKRKEYKSKEFDQFIKYLRLCSEHDAGEEFDTYIDNWAKRLLKRK